MDRLEEARLRKLEEQREASNHLNELLTKEGGLIHSQRLTCKNLEAAVAVSRQPGYFEYYDPPAEVKRVYRTGECGVLVRRILKTQQDLDALAAEAETKRAEDRAARMTSRANPDLASLDQWFAQYGHPRQTGAQGFLSEFDKETKVYGGSAYHRAFRSQAVRMRKGRILR